jgi:nitronate monooxygenase
MSPQRAGLHDDYPWTTPGVPLIVAAPMMKITMAKLAVAASAFGGVGFLAAGFDLTPLAKDLAEAAELVKSSDIRLHNDTLPIGVGFQNWGADLAAAIDALHQNPVAIAWFFAPKQLSDLLPWSKGIRAATNSRTKIWIQIGTVVEALEVAKTSRPDVLVVQGADSGGHGLTQRAGIVTLLPEVADALKAEGIDIPLIAAGGIMDSRGVAAAICLGADGVCLGTRFLASEEAVIAKGYQNEILRISDGGVSTVGTKVYDQVRGIHGWPVSYNGRGVANMSYLDALSGMPDEENEALYKEAMQLGDQGWGPEGRMTTYAGTGVGLVREVKSVKDIVKELQDGSLEILKERGGQFNL